MTGSPADGTDSTRPPAVGDRAREPAGADDRAREEGGTDRAGEPGGTDRARGPGGTDRDPGPGNDHSTDPAPVPRARPYDPEKGLRGVMSATLILEAIAVLLALPVAVNTGSGVGPIGVAVICLLAALMVGTCALISRPYAVPIILGLQAVMIACWLISPPLGVMGIVFALVWAIILWFRGEFRRRLAAGTLPGPPQPSGP